MDPTACMNFIRNASDATPAQIREHGEALRGWLAHDGFPPMDWDRVRAFEIADKAARVTCWAGVERLRRFIAKAGSARQHEILSGSVRS